MSINKTPLSTRVRLLLGSQIFWYFVLGLFVLQALWLVISAQYPMAFDENYHFGLIQLHAHQWLPFFTGQPPHAGAYGAAVRDPSYLYHWLMSFPYRLISLFTHNQTTQIICLRLINVALFTYALVLYRKVLRRIGVSAAFASSALLIFTLIPVVPFLAAHINYDNLLMVAVPLTVLLATDVLAALSAKRIPAGRSIALLSVMLLASLIKYPFLPVLAVVVLYLLWRIWRGRLWKRAALRASWDGFMKLSKLLRAVLVVVLIVSAGLFVERYGDNVIQYRTPVPACDNVIDSAECSEYGPWERDDGFARHKSASFHPSPVGYTMTWFHGMWYRLFFAINYTYANDPPLFLISRVAIVMAALLVLGIIVRAKLLFRGHSGRTLLLLIILGYGLALFADNYAEYVRTGVAVAINGRYWIPFLPFIFALGGLAWSDILRTKPAVKAWTAALVIAVFLLQGGGTMTYIVRSDDTWYWNNSLVRRVNADVRGIVSPIIFGKGLD